MTYTEKFNDVLRNQLGLLVLVIMSGHALGFNVIEPEKWHWGFFWIIGVCSFYSFREPDIESKIVWTQRALVWTCFSLCMLVFSIF